MNDNELYYLRGYLEGRKDLARFLQHKNWIKGKKFAEFVQTYKAQNLSIMKQIVDVSEEVKVNEDNED